MKKKSIRLLLIGITLVTIILITLFIYCSKKDNQVEIKYEQSELELIIQAKQPEIKIEDPIYLEILLKNVGGRSVVINQFLSTTPHYLPNKDKSLVFKIINPQNEVLTYNCSLGHHFITESDFIELYPGKGLISTENMMCFDFDDFGIYSITATYYNYINKPDGTPAWTGSVQSNTIQIEIVP